MATLIGMKAICEHMRRSEATVLMLHRDMNFPMQKLGGIWESDTEIIAAWRKERIHVNYFIAGEENGRIKSQPAQKKRK